jgi:hypothetical protein
MRTDDGSGVMSVTGFGELLRRYRDAIHQHQKFHRRFLSVPGNDPIRCSYA